LPQDDDVPIVYQSGLKTTNCEKQKRGENAPFLVLLGSYYLLADIK
jgi:hypothetical protein